MSCCLKKWENVGENLEQYQLGNRIVLASSATHYRLPHLSAEIDGNDRPNGFVFTAVSNPVALNCHFGHGVAIRSNREPTSKLSGWRSEPAVSAVIQSGKAWIIELRQFISADLRERLKPLTHQEFSTQDFEIKLSFLDKAGKSRVFSWRILDNVLPIRN